MMGAGPVAALQTPWPLHAQGMNALQEQSSMQLPSESSRVCSPTSHIEFPQIPANMDSSQRGGKRFRLKHWTLQVQQVMVVAYLC